MCFRAPLRGTVSLYCYLDNSKVMILKENYKFIVVDNETFHELYFELDSKRAALKVDCIKYAIYESNKPLDEYPEWFRESIKNGDIFSGDGYDYIVYDDNGDTAMSPGSVVLKNLMGHLKYMERDDFDKYYEIIGG